MEQFVQGIERIGLLALAVIVVCVAIMLIVSITDRYPARGDSMTKRTHAGRSPEKIGDAEEPDSGPE